MTWPTFIDKVAPVLLTAFLAAVVVIAWGLAGCAVREALCPSPWPQAPCVGPSDPH